jgi:hypothetical protein
MCGFYFFPTTWCAMYFCMNWAHVTEMNHSRRYWTLLEAHEPNYLALDRELRAAWRLIPEWIRPRQPMEPDAL